MTSGIDGRVNGRIECQDLSHVGKLVERQVVGNIGGRAVGITAVNDQPILAAGDNRNRRAGVDEIARAADFVAKRVYQPPAHHATGDTQVLHQHLLPGGQRGFVNPAACWRVQHTRAGGVDRQ